MKLNSILLSIAIVASFGTAFAQSAPAGSTATTTAAKPASVNTTPFELADASVTELCRNLKAAGTKDERETAVTELGKFKVHCLGHSHAPRIVSRPAAVPKDSTQSVDTARVLALVHENAALKVAALQKAELPCTRRYISVVNTVPTAGPCVGHDGDVVFQAVTAQPAPTTLTAPTILNVGVVGGGSKVALPLAEGVVTAGPVVTDQSCTFTNKANGKVQDLKVASANELGVAVTTGQACGDARNKLEAKYVASGAKLVSKTQ